MRRKNFTLIELLTVMAIIVALATILLVSLRGIPEAARRRQAETEMANIVSQCNQFYLDYHMLPAKLKGTLTYKSASTKGNVDCVFLGSGTEPRQLISDLSQQKYEKWGAKCSWSVKKDLCEQNKELSKGYLQFFDTLCATSLEDGNAKNFILASDNARQYNERCVQYLKPKAHYFDTDKTTQGFRDPWGKPYIVLLDTNYDMCIPYPAYITGTGGGKTMERAAVMSFKWDEEATTAAENLSKITVMPHSWQD